MLLWMLVIAFAAALKGTLSSIKMVASGPKEGRVPGSLTLACTVMGAPLDSPRYDWNCARQAPGGQLQFLAWIYPFGNNTGYAPPFQGRVTISADKDKNKVSLQLHALTDLDTPTYFCARQHTIQEESAPEVSVLKSKEPKLYDNKLSMACLARTFYPKNISLDVPKNDTVYDLKAPLVTSEGMYSTMKVVGVESDAEVTSGLKTAVVKMEKVNMLFMAGLGLRVLLAKSIAFNTIMSIRLFLF
ncbi:PREDICTED: uncharacterized protein LOC104289959 [Charadrius vociferus]|nr:PREDICTED: uncharacterized protein LOC104289959 [Charadrius vociferus]